MTPVPSCSEVAVRQQFKILTISGGKWFTFVLRMLQLGGIPCSFRQYHAVSYTTIQLQLQTIPCNTKDGAPGCNWAPLNSPQAMFQNPPILRQLWIEAPLLDLKQPLKNLLIFNHLWPRQPLLVDFQGTLKMDDLKPI